MKEDWFGEAKARLRALQDQAARGTLTERELRDRIMALLFESFQSSLTERELKDLFGIPSAYFAPLPAGAVRSDAHAGHFPEQVCIGWSIWPDDGGLLKADFRLGETVTLTDHHGLHAVIRIDARDGAAFLGTGTVEGYTTARPREIRIETDGQGVRALTFFTDENDRAAYESFPLWREAVEHQRALTRILDSVLDRLCRHPSEDGSPSNP